jgi:hypothetical protein
MEIKGAISSRSDTFYTVRWKALTETNISHLATGTVTAGLEIKTWMQDKL